MGSSKSSESSKSDSSNSKQPTSHMQCTHVYVHVQEMRAVGKTENIQNKLLAKYSRDTHNTV